MFDDDPSTRPAVPSRCLSRPVGAARHLLVLGTDSRTVMDLMAWSTPRMAAVYQHFVDDVKRNIADRMDVKLGLGDGSSS